jgi:hypothetical protein
MTTFFRYLIARRFLIRHFGKRAARLLPGGWITFLVYPLVRRAWKRRMKRARSLAAGTG